MAKDSKSHTFRGVSVFDAICKAKVKLGQQLQIISCRNVRRSGSGDSEPPEVELVVMTEEDARAAAAEAAERPAPAAAPNPMVRNYLKALEGKERQNAAAVARQTIVEEEAAGPLVSLGETSNGIANRLEEFKRELEKTSRENNALRNYMMDMLSLQARNGLPAVGRELMEVYHRMVSLEVDENLAREIIEKIQYDNPGIAGGDRITALLRAEAARRIPVAGPLLLGDEKPMVVALVGPSGTGKSTAVAKLAIEFSFNMHLSVGLINEDLRRPGADRQMSNLANLINVPMASANDTRGIADAVRSMSGKDIILVDTAGRSPRDSKGIGELNALLRAAGVRETHLTLSCVTSGKMLKEMAVRFKPAGFDRLILTKLDESLLHGSILNLASSMSEGLSYVTDGPDYMKPIRAADNHWLADLALGLINIDGEDDGA